jgi:phosphoribosylformylglycinamidine synthase
MELLPEMDAWSERRAQAMARMSVGESLTNLVWAKVTDLGDVKVSGNWMWAAKLAGECSTLWDAAIAMKECMLGLGVAVQGGKDSLSMAAKAGDKLIKSPGSLTISAYGPCTDVALTVTPNFKHVGSAILLVDLCKPGNPGRLGGSSLAQALDATGGECPDVDSTEVLRSMWKVTQELIQGKKLRAGHDRRCASPCAPSPCASTIRGRGPLACAAPRNAGPRRSDGGLITTLLEMAFSSGLGFDVDLAGLGMDAGDDAIPVLFGEDLVRRSLPRRCGRQH